MPRNIVVLILLSVSASLSQVAYRPEVPSPDKVLGYELGARFSSHSSIEKYLLALRDAAPERIHVIPYGKTYEERTLYLVVLSSPDNMKRIDQIRSNILRLSDPRKTNDADAKRIIRQTPPVVWLSYGVHGNEASSPEAALNVMYQLAARTDEEVKFLMENLVVVIDPLLNPDGHERYVNFQTSRRGATPVEDRNAAEHNEDWPSGRTNHYLFDLNRDWAWLTQTESEARVKAYLGWKPQVHVDFHEMGYNSSYFFFPAAKPINKNFPRKTLAWADIFGKANASAFDAHGWSYWTSDRFDLFYPGYGDSWPSLNGAIGMTYEQAGGVGVRARRNDETILTLKDRIDHHSATSFATLKATAEHRADMLNDFYNFFRDAVTEGSDGPIETYILNPENDPGRAHKLANLLAKQGVEVLYTASAFSASGLHTYFSNSEVSRKFNGGAYIIRMNQPSKRLIATLLEQESSLTDTSFYDISSWALPVAYGVETYWSSSPVSPPDAKLLKQSSSTPEENILSGEIVGGRASYAYVIKSQSNSAMRALIHLLQNDVKVNVALKEFSMSGEQFPRGSLIIPILGNPPELYTQLRSLAESYNVDIYAANTGFTQRGITLGSDRVVRIRKPKIIVISNAPVGTESFGAIWSLFDRQYELQFVPMKLSQLRNADLHDYTAMVFPDDYSDGYGYRSQLDSAATQKIKTWIAGGGTFVGIEGGAAFASASVGKIASVKLKERKKEEKKDEKKDAGAEKKDENLSEEELEKRMTVEEKERKKRMEEIPGTMMRVKIDQSHPIGFGYTSTAAVLKTSGTMFELSGSGYNVAMYTKSPRLSGYISKENEKMLEETPFIVHEHIGAGNVILFSDDPNFRLFCDGLNRLFLNSVLIIPGVRDVSLTSDQE